MLFTKSLRFFFFAKTCQIDLTHPWLRVTKSNLRAAAREKPLWEKWSPHAHHRDEPLTLSWSLTSRVGPRWGDPQMYLDRSALWSGPWAIEVTDGQVGHRTRWAELDGAQSPYSMWWISDVAGTTTTYVFESVTPWKDWKRRDKNQEASSRLGSKLPD